MKRCAVLAVMCLLAISACKKEAAPPPTPPPPPPPTADQLAQKVMSKITPLISPDPQSGKALRETLSMEVGSLKTELNGAEAQHTILNNLTDQLTAAHQNEQWDLVLNLCDAVDVLDPGNTRTSRYRQRALDEKNRPQVTVKGFVELDGVTSVFLDIYLPATGETDHKQVREGEEVDGVVVERIIGNNKGVRVRYDKTGATWDVMK